MYYYPYYFDSSYLLVIAAAIFSMIASSKVNSAYNKYAKVSSASGITAGEVAKQILQNNGITDIEIRRTSGHLTDRYVPGEKAIYLSDYDSRSIAAIGVAAHECGHAVQYHVGYFPVRLRTAIYPLCAIGSNLGMPLLLIGLLISLIPLINLGIIMFSLSFLFSVLTLPVEYNASDRALLILRDYHILNAEELKGTTKVLRAAGLTYVAAAASGLATLLRLLMISGRRRND